MLDPEYNINIEQEIQKYWEENNSFKVTEDNSKEKFYALSMFPYPSGKMHMGHVRNYTITDCISRFQRLLAKNVMQPMGFDSFGLPAENAALQYNTTPKEWTYKNIASIGACLRKLGLSIDWSRSFATSDPDYYKWSQYIFLEMYKHGFIYKKLGPVNWDPIEETVLANEQVIDGKGWRSGADIIKKNIPMYYIDTKSYAKELLDELEDLKDWPDSVKNMQKKWIGKSDGIMLDLKFINTDSRIEVFTEQAKAMHLASFVELSTDHPIVNSLYHKPEIADFISRNKFGAVSEAELTKKPRIGIYTGIELINPHSNKILSLYISNYVLGSHNIRLGIPALNKDDYIYADANGLAKPEDDNHRLKVCDIKGRKHTSYRLKDWGISRQRFWGCPIPLYHCNNCGDMADYRLPIVLPDVYKKLETNLDWINTTCTKCGGPAKREKDTLDTFFESSWYFLRYCSVFNKNKAFDKSIDYWMNNGGVDIYVGGIEHAILHLLYSRCFTKILRDIGILNISNPFKKLLTQGMVVAPSYYRIANNKTIYYSPEEVDFKKDGAYLKSEGHKLITGASEKMSKSKSNGVCPEKLISIYGADSIRLFTLFASPPSNNLEWNENGISGAYKFISRLWTLARNYQLKLDYKSPVRAIHQELVNKYQDALIKIKHNYEHRLQFNTSIALLMELLNYLESVIDSISLDQEREIIRGMLIVLSPMTPYVTKYIWESLFKAEKFEDIRYPELRPDLIKHSSYEIIVQINGKKRATVLMQDPITQETVLEAIHLNVPLNPMIKNYKKIIFIPNKLINIVV